MLVLDIVNLNPLAHPCSDPGSTPEEQNVMRPVQRNPARAVQRGDVAQALTALLSM